ncbi:DUF6480 family protein [Streptomyces sp. NPDC060194]|uniref:DUF6480 family protein n=1 Tax=Streptomyces sp. NPDC060194 TaxID=3347069 RepID=UPI00364AC7AB
MTEPLVPPEETPPVEGSIAEAHEEEPDKALWSHPGMWVGLIVFGCVLIVGFFVGRLLGF